MSPLHTNTSVHHFLICNDYMKYTQCFKTERLPLQILCLLFHPSQARHLPRDIITPARAMTPVLLISKRGSNRIIPGGLRTPPDMAEAGEWTPTLISDKTATDLLGNIKCQLQRDWDITWGAYFCTADRSKLPVHDLPRVNLTVNWPIYLLNR